MAAARPRFDPTPSKPKDSAASKTASNCSFGAAGVLLRQARATPKSASSPGLRLGPSKSCRSLEADMESANDQKLQRHGSNRGIRSPKDVQKAVERKNSAGYISSVQNRKDDFLEMCLGGPDAVFEHMVDQQEKGDKENMIEISKENMIEISKGKRKV